jgi:hypothetical protein
MHARPWNRLRRRYDWRDARAARPSSPSAGAAIAAMSTAACAAPPRPAPRACAVPVAAIARAPKAGLTTGIESAIAAGAGARESPAWGITLPRHPPPLPESSRPGLWLAARCCRARCPQIPILWRLNTMRSHSHRPLATAIACSTAHAAMHRLATLPAPGSKGAGAPLATRHEGHGS